MGSFFTVYTAVQYSPTYFLNKITYEALPSHMCMLHVAWTENFKGSDFEVR